MTDTPKPDALHYLADRFNWAAPGDRQEDAWIIRFCDNDRREAIFTGPDAEAEAWAAWEKYAPAWNCYVFRLARLASAPAAAVEGREMVERCAASPDHADLLETIGNAADDWQAKGYPTALAEVRDMANVGRALMDALPVGYCYNDCPSEIVSDLQNERDEAFAAPSAPHPQPAEVQGLVGAAAWQPMETAPKDGTILELVVDYADGGGPLQDAVVAPTIGWNTFGDTGEDKWHFAGWSWTHDYLCAGSGEVIAWRPSRLNACDGGLGSLPPRAALAAFQPAGEASPCDQCGAPIGWHHTDGCTRTTAAPSREIEG